MLDMDVIYREYADSVFRFLMTLCREECTAEELTEGYAAHVSGSG